MKTLYRGYEIVPTKTEEKSFVEVYQLGNYVISADTEQEARDYIDELNKNKRPERGFLVEQPSPKLQKPYVPIHLRRAKARPFDTKVTCLADRRRQRR